jgi:hypothetical protein
MLSGARNHLEAAARLALLACLLGAAGCRSGTEALPPESPEQPGVSDPALVVRMAGEELVLAAWAEPRRLPAGGGETQILVRVQRRGGRPFPGVEVRLVTSTGMLYSGGRVLKTDDSGMTRDRLTTKRTATVTLNAGGTRYSLRVTVAPRS